MALILIGGLLSIGYTGSGIGDDIKLVKLNEMVKSGDLDRIPEEDKNEIVDSIK